MANKTKQKEWVLQMVKNIHVDHVIPLEVDNSDSAEGMRFKLRGRFISPRFSEWHGGLDGAEQFLNGFTEALDYMKKGEK